MTATVERPGLVPVRASDPQTVAYWEWFRTTPGSMPSHQTLVHARLEHVVDAALTLLEWLGAPDDGDGAAVLDVSAGGGGVGRLVRHHRAKITYHVTEQSDFLTKIVKERSEASAGATWRCDPDGPSLRQALSDAGDTFRRGYDLVVACNVIDCLPSPSPHVYQFLDGCWELVKPRGFLLVAVQRHLHHRVHPVPWDWDRLMGTLAQYAQPVMGFDDAQGGNLVAAIAKGAEAGAEA